MDILKLVFNLFKEREPRKPTLAGHALARGRRAKISARKVLRDPLTSKKQMTKAGLALTQRKPV